MPSYTVTFTTRLEASATVVIKASDYAHAERKAEALAADLSILRWAGSDKPDEIEWDESDQKTTVEDISED